MARRDAGPRWWLLTMLASARLLAATVPIESFAQAEPGPGWPQWGQPLGEAAGQCAWSVVREGQVTAGQVVFRRARGMVLLPMPEVAVSGRPTTLALRVLGDGSGAALSLTVMDANGEWLATPGVPVTWRGWRQVKLDLRRFVRWARGDEDGLPDPPVSLWTLNVEFGLPMDGSLAFDDMLLHHEPWLPFDYLDSGLDGPAECRVYLPEDRAPNLALVNRSAVSLPVLVTGEVGGEKIQQEALVNPRDSTRVALPRVKASGPVELSATLSVGTATRELRYRYAVLPAVNSTPDAYFGLGRYTLDDLLDGRLLRELPDLRAASAGWTLVRLRRSLGEALLTNDEWGEALTTLSVAKALGLRLMAEAPAESLLAADAARNVVGVGLARLAPHLAGCLVDARRLDNAEQVAAAVSVAREAMPAGRRLLVRAEHTPPDCEARLIDLPPLLPAPPGPFPRAWRALAALLDGPDPRPGWLLAEFWPGAELTGVADPAAAAALTLIAARCVPRIEAAALGRLQGRPGEQALLSTRLDLSEPFLAWAVAARQLSGLEPRGVSELAAGVYEMRADGARGLRVVWTEGAAFELTPALGEDAYDLLGRRLTGTSLTIGPAPVYLVSAKREPAPAR